MTQMGNEQNKTEKAPTEIIVTNSNESERKIKFVFPTPLIWRFSAHLLRWGL